jgi:hypothetical protein
MHGQMSTTHAAAPSRRRGPRLAIHLALFAITMINDLYS